MKINNFVSSNHQLIKKVLVIDDDFDVIQLLKKFLIKKNYAVSTALSGTKGLQLFDKESPDLVLCDYQLGDLDGSEVLAHIKKQQHAPPVIIMTGYSNIKTAVNVIKQGAFDYITKPLCAEEILRTIQNALGNHINNDGNKEDATTSISNNRIHEKKVVSVFNDNYLILKNGLSKVLYDQIDLVAPTNYSVIIYGESGSGKEAVAQMIHSKSPRRDMPFIAMDCGAISGEVAGSELFGHEKGSFTGAIATKIGHFEMANGGTLFLDEVANLSYDIQTSLLRVIQERKLKRIGGTKEIGLNVRIIIASNEDLAGAYRNGKFREDLYHRFNEFSIVVPPLRSRKEDILNFANFFLQQTNKELCKNLKGFDEAVINCFLAYSWPGNLRELKNVIKRAALFSNEKIDLKSLPSEISHYYVSHHTDDNFQSNKETSASTFHFSNSGHGKTVAVSNQLIDKPNLKFAAHEAEYDVIIRVLKECDYNKSRAAKYLNIDRKTLYNKLRAF